MEGSTDDKKRGSHVASIVCAAVVIIYFFFPGILILPLIVAFGDPPPAWLNEAVNTAFTPLEYLSRYIPGYSSLVEREMDLLRPIYEAMTGRSTGPHHHR